MYLLQRFPITTRQFNWWDLLCCGSSFFKLLRTLSVQGFFKAFHEYVLRILSDGAFKLLISFLTQIAIKYLETNYHLTVKWVPFAEHQKKQANTNCLFNLSFWHDSEQLWEKIYVPLKKGSYPNLPFECVLK